MRRRAAIPACVLAAWTAGATAVFGQAPKAADPAPPRKAEADNPAKVERVLQLWEDACARLKTLDVKIFRIDFNLAWDENRFFEGRARFEKPNLALVEFREIQQDKQAEPVKDPQTRAWISQPKLTSLYKGPEVRYYDFDAKRVDVRLFAKDEAVRTMEREPALAFFEIKADEVKKRYALTLIGGDEKTHTIRMVPQPGAGPGGFGQAFVQLDGKYCLPLRVVLHSPDGKFRKDFQFSAIKPNVELEAGTFEAKSDPSWKERKFALGGLVGIPRLW
jgi:hypothetical protein